MSKPHEETWIDEGSDGTLLYRDEDGDDIEFGNIPDPDRARLAAAAPEMARLLLELAAKWVAEQNGGPCYFRCESCEFEVVKPGSAENHADDCRLVAVLRKAGVLP